VTVRTKTQTPTARGPQPANAKHDPNALEAALRERWQSHYDLSDEFYRLFLDSTQTTASRNFDPEDITLRQAQMAKIDLSLGKLDLQPGMLLCSTWLVAGVRPMGGQSKSTTVQRVGL